MSTRVGVGVLVLVALCLGQEDPLQAQNRDQALFSGSRVNVSVSADRVRYVKTTVALACNGKLIVRASDQGKREKANDKTLKDNGFTRASYMEIAYKYAGNTGAAAEIDRGIRSCPKPNPLELLPQKYSGNFNSGNLTGSMAVTLKQGKVKGIVKGTVNGEKFTLNFTHGSGLSVNARGQIPGKDTINWHVRGTLRESSFYGTIYLTHARRSSRSSFNILPSN